MHLASSLSLPLPQGFALDFLALLHSFSCSLLKSPILLPSSSLLLLLASILVLSVTPIVHSTHVLAVMHGCIVATVQLYHPDGRESLRPSKGGVGMNGAIKGLPPGTKRAPLGDELDPFQGTRFLCTLYLCSLLRTLHPSPLQIIAPRMCNITYTPRIPNLILFEPVN